MNFLILKNKLYSDLNLEIRKKWNRKFSSIFTYINLFYDKSYLETRIYNEEHGLGLLTIHINLGVVNHLD